MCTCHAACASSGATPSAASPSSQCRLACITTYGRGPPRSIRSRATVSNTIGAMIYGSKGYMVVSDEDHGTYTTFLGREQQPGPERKELGNNWANFIEAVRSRKHSDLNAPIEEGAISTTLVHLANISYR